MTQTRGPQPKGEGAAMSLVLFAIRVLRRLPRTARFDAHLDRCAAIEVFHVPHDNRFRPLRLMSRN